MTSDGKQTNDGISNRRSVTLLYWQQYEGKNVMTKKMHLLIILYYMKEYAVKN